MALHASSPVVGSKSQIVAVNVLEQERIGYPVVSRYLGMQCPVWPVTSLAKADY